MNTDRALDSIAQLIVRCVDPDEIVLFGSAAGGRARPHSDIDLLVLGPFREPPVRRGLELRGLLERFAPPVDLHLLTPDEFETQARREFAFADMIKRHGVTLYRRPGHAD